MTEIFTEVTENDKGVFDKPSQITSHTFPLLKFAMIQQKSYCMFILITKIMIQLSLYIM